MAFSNTSQSQIVEKINNWFQKLNEKEFKEEVEDFLVLINRYSPQEIVENKSQTVKAPTTSNAWVSIKVVNVDLNQSISQFIWSDMIWYAVYLSEWINWIEMNKSINQFN